MTTSVSDTQRLRGESTNGAISPPGTTDRTRARPANQLDFLQAMRDFKFMFPTMEEEVIEAVLRANNGIVDATVDQLLTMSVDFRDIPEDPDVDDVDGFSNSQPPPPTIINGVKLKPSHTMASSDAMFRDVLSTNSGPIPKSASSNALKNRVTEEENLLLSLDSAVPDVPVLNPPVPHRLASQPAVNGLPLLIDAPISDFLQGLPAYNDQSESSALGQISSAMPAAAAAVASPDSQPQVTPARPPKAARHPDSALAAPTKFRSANDGTPVGPVKRLPWSPPLLGNLPDDFLRVMPDSRTQQQPPPLPAKSSHHHSHHSASATTATPSSRMSATTHSAGREHHRSHHHQQRSSPTVEPNVTRTFSDIRHLHGKSHNRTPTPTGTGGLAAASHHHASNGMSGVHHISRSQTYKPPSSSSTATHRHPENGGVHHMGSSARSPTSRQTTGSAAPTPVSHLGQGQGLHTLQAHNARSLHIRDVPPLNDMGDVISPYLRHKMAENERRLQDADLDPEVMQMLRDERLALVLQNEEFLSELRNDKDFLRVLEKDRLNATAFEPMSTGDSDNSREGDEHAAAAATAGGVKDENAEFRRQLKYMGGSSRKTLMAKAKQFFSRKKRTPRPVLIKGPMGVSTLHLLDDEDGEDDGGINQLALVMDDEDEDEEAGRVPAVPQHALVQRPLNSSDVIITRCHESDVC